MTYKKRYRGCPRPAPERVEAQLDFLRRATNNTRESVTVNKQSTSLIRLPLSESEIDYLRELLYSELHRKNNLMQHAVAHGTDIYDPTLATCRGLLNKMQQRIDLSAIDATAPDE